VEAACANSPKFLQLSTESIPKIARCNLGGGQANVFLGGNTRMVFWTYSRSQQSQPGIHRYDEYIVVVEGCYTVVVNGTSTACDQVNRADIHIPGGVRHSREVIGGSRTIHVFGPSSQQTIESASLG
jgi:hypothetical protein